MVPTIARLNELAAAWSVSLLRATWQGAVAIAAAWVLVRCWRGLPPRVACWIWRLADLKLMAALLWITPLCLPLLPPPAGPGPEPRMDAPARDRPRSRAAGSGPTPFRAGRPAAVPPTSRLSAASAVFLLWMSGVVGAAALAARDGLASVRLRRACRPVDCPEVRDVATRLARALGLGIVPELRAGPVVDRPMLVGVLRSAILLPAAVLDDRRSAVAIRSILAHELAHVRRLDLLWGAAAGLVRALFYFHPLVWLAHREALVAREAACDALALRAAGLRPSEYGLVLLEIATGGPERPPRWAEAPGMAGSTGSLKRRLIAMKTTQPPSSRLLLSWALTLLVVGAAGVIPWQLVPREARAQVPAAPESARAGQGGPAPAAPSRDPLEIAEAHLRVVQAEQKVAEAEQEVAEEILAQRDAEVERWDVEVQRLQGGVDRGVIDPQVLLESRNQAKASHAARDAAEAALRVARASRDAARAEVREAEALRTIARAALRGQPDARAEADLKAAREQLREARRDRARAEHDAARAENDRAEANLARAEAEARRWETEVQRLEREVQRGVVDPQVLLESRNQWKASTAAREARRAQVRLVHARLEAAEARLKLAEAEAGAASRGPSNSPPAAPR